MKSLNLKYIPELDHLRFFAALMITIFHLANGPLVHYLHLDIGITFFFTLSGYLFFIIASQKKEKIIYWKFIYNRILRIYPLIIFLFFLAIVIIDNFKAIDFINLLGLNLPGKERISWHVGDWNYQYLSFNWWTIGVEFCFYFTFPFLYRFYTEKGLKFLLSLFLLIVIFKHGLYYSLLNDLGWKKLSICLNYSVFGNFDTFIVGMIFGHICIKFKDKSYFFALFSSKLIFTICLLTSWFIFINCLNKLDAPSYTLVASPLCALLIICYSWSFANTSNTKLSKKLSYLGSMSFSIYLLHDFVKIIGKNTGIDAHLRETLVNSFSCTTDYCTFILTFAFYIPIILVISHLTFNTIEKPFLSMRTKYFQPKKQEVDENEKEAIYSNNQDMEKILLKQKT